FANAHSNLGTVLKDLGNLKEAEFCFQKAIEINPNFANAHFNLGYILQELGNITEAELSLRKALKINNDLPEAHNNLGNILKDLGKLEESEKSYRKAIKIKPSFVMAHFNLGNILKDLGKVKEAENYYRKAIELNPNFVDAKINLDLITRQKVPQWHIPMMNDNERNNAYLIAIKSAIKENDYVLEIGTGSGLLSMMSIDAGAKKVTTCEASETIAETAKKIIKKNGYSDSIEVINKKSTELNIHTDLEKKADLIISEILSSEFVGEGVQISLSDANRRLIKENGRMIPEAGEIKIALLESSPEIDKELFVQKVNGYDLSEFNNIMGSKYNVQYLGRKTKTSFLSEAKVAFSFDFYNKDIINRKEKIIEIEACKSGTTIGLITWLRLNLYKDIYFENKPIEICTSGWVNPIYKFTQPLEITKGELIKVKATLLKDRVWYELI
ncbi:tetratricopeptide repeat protein, partial [Prochlorococcus marinus]|uniref:tetratricopeptide repeat protein n=1 Tax=Prochlorococcus marinus TaxID=1219 RepID=UPI001C56291A